MMDEQTNLFENECLRRWLETTRIYVFADMDSLPGTSAKASDGDEGNRPAQYGHFRTSLTSVRAL